MFYKNIRRYTRHHISKQTAAYSRNGSKKYKQEHIVHISLADSCIYSYYCKNPKPDRVHCQHDFIVGLTPVPLKQFSLEIKNKENNAGSKH